MLSIFLQIVDQVHLRFIAVVQLLQLKSIMLVSIICVYPYYLIINDILINSSNNGTYICLKPKKIGKILGFI